MENKEFAFQGKTINGILMLVINLLVFLTGIGMFVLACLSEEHGRPVYAASAAQCSSS